MAKYTSTWDATRRAVDAAGGERGLFILTGSSTPAKDAVTHSGAGRIARVDMSTMTLWERGLSTGSVSLSGLFEGAFDPSACETSLAPLADAICCGGWPALVGADAQTAAEVVDQAAARAQQRRRAREDARRPAGRFDHRAGVLHAHARAFGDQVHQQLAKGQDGFPGKGTGVGSVHFHLDRTTFFLSQQLFISNNYEI